MKAEQAQYLDHQRVNQKTASLVILLTLKYSRTEVAVFT